MATETTQNTLPDVHLQVPSSQWLQDGRSLKSARLTLDQILSRLGFRQKEGRLPGSTSSVTSVYAEGCFLQHPDSSGRVYNVCAGEGVMAAEEGRLHGMIQQLQARLEWLNSDSRLVFGVVTHKHVVIVVDSTIRDTSRLHPFLSAVSGVVTEQLPATRMFNIVRCCGGFDRFSDGLVETSEDTLVQASKWLRQNTPLSVTSNTNILEALEYATHCSNVDAVYLYTQGNSALRAFHALNEKLAESPVPVYVSVYECREQVAVKQYEEVADTAHTRLHLYNKAASIRPPPGPSDHQSPSSSRPSSGRSNASASSSTSGRVVPSIPREDVLLVWEELEEARDTLAELQAIRLELNERSDRYTRVPPPPQPPHEDYMSSAQWLAVHGVKANSVMFDDLVNSLAFQHCEGVLKRSGLHTSTADTEIISSKLIRAQYCKSFVHMRWKDGRVVHVHLAERCFNNYRNTMLRLVTIIKKRMSWLKHGSRELFGAVMENNVVVAVDTSSSMRGRLSLVKRKLQQLMEQQLKHKHSFNLIQFSSEVVCWRDHMVPPAGQNMMAARQWISQLQPNGSTDTLGVLKAAIQMDGVEGVYLLTDGRPDQSTDTILNQVHRMKQVPVHTISFNCADSKANRFLARLAAVTGGRYHYYCVDMTDPSGPPSHRSDDLRLLEEEVELAQHQLERAAQLREECVRLQVCGQQHHQHDPASCYGGGKGKLHAHSKRSHKKKIKSLDGAMSTCKDWLQHNSLSVRQLTLMDALGPAAVPHNSQHVPILDKHVRGRVFEQVLSHAHLTNSGRMSLINPQGVDLIGYTNQLDSYMNECGQTLMRTLWVSLSSEDKDELRTELHISESELPSYSAHWERTKQFLASHHLSEELDQDLHLLEKEISQAVAYKQQALALHDDISKKKSGCKQHLPPGDDCIDTDSHESLSSGVDGSVASLSLSHISSNKSQQWPVGKPVKLRQYLKGHHVIACSTQDGLYYPGMVVAQPDTHHSLVRLHAGHQERVTNTDLIMANGAGPCPPLHIGDYVLARVRARKLSETDVYMPGVVYVLPVNPRAALGLHTVCAVGGRSLVCARRALVKIGYAKYKKICAHLTTLLAMRKNRDKPPSQSSPTSTNAELEETNEEQGEKEEEEEEKEETVNSENTSRSSSTHSDSSSNTETGVSPGPGRHTSSSGQQTHTSNASYTSHQSPTIEQHKDSNTSVTTDRSPPIPVMMVDRASSPQPLMVDEGTSTDPVRHSVAVLTDPMVQDVSVGTEWQSPVHEYTYDSGTLSSNQQNTELNKRSRGEKDVNLNDDDKSEEEEEDAGKLSLSMLDQSGTNRHLVSTHVLSRWLDDGWYYRSVVVGGREDGCYQVQDATGAVQMVPRHDIITDQDDANRLLCVGDPVIALHPAYPHSYAPARVTGLLTDGLHFNVLLYDDTPVILPRHEVYTVNNETHELAVQYIRQCERAWVGRPVIAKRDSDGMFHPGVVTELVDDKPQYMIRWSDGSTQLQSPLYMFGELTTKRPLHIGDYVIAQADPGDSEVYDAGRIMDIQGDKLVILLSNGVSTLAAPETCYWVTREYYTTVSPATSE